MSERRKSRFFNSIVNKVRLSILGTAVVAVVVSGAFVMVSEYAIYRDGFVDNVSSFSDILAHNLSASIVFENESEATKTLNALATVPSVEAAFVTGVSGEVFALYRRGGQASDAVSPNPDLWDLNSSEPVSKIVDGLLLYSKPVILDGERVGVLHVRASLDEIYGRIQFQLLALAVILLIAILIAFAAGSAMQRFITVPIQQLVRAMRNVSETRTYDININKGNDDEIGVLVDGFNEMLREIHARDRMLAAANDELEEQVQDRTRELESANSELSRTLVEVEQSKDAAEAANRAKGAFLATMSHEIRTPINGLLGNTELLLNEPLNEAARKYGEIAYQSGEALLDIINDILDFSRIEAGKLEFAESEFDLGRVTSQLCVSLTPQIRQKGIELLVDLDDAPTNLVRGDSGRVRQVLSNLVTNAAKFTQSGHIKVTLSCDPARDHRVLPRFEVEDTGIGITQADQKIIFGRFAQADDSSSRAFGGTGLGLAICKELVTRMGGEIGVESDYGKGARFWFTLSLPSTDKPVSEAPLPVGRFNVAITPIESLNCRVLVVDDNEINRDMAKQMLQKFGCFVEAAMNGEEAVRLATANQYDLVLMDCQMPVMDGFRATRRIRAHESDNGRAPTFIVALTANAIKGDRDRCIQAGMNDYLAKPFKLSDIRATVEHAIERSAVAPVYQEDSAIALSEILDPDAIEKIRSIDQGQDDALFKRYVGIFVESTPGLIDRMRGSLKTQNSEELTFAAHSLKSDSFAVGALALGDFARKLELLGREQSFAGVAELVDSTSNEFERVRCALHKALKAG